MGYHLDVSDRCNCSFGTCKFSVITSPTRNAQAFPKERIRFFMFFANGCVVPLNYFVTNCRLRLFVHLTESAIQPLILSVVSARGAPSARRWRSRNTDRGRPFFYNSPYPRWTNKSNAAQQKPRRGENNKFLLSPKW